MTTITIADLAAAPPDPREPNGCPTPGACSCIAPDPRDKTIARLSTELEAARNGLERLARLVPFPARDELGVIHPQIRARAAFARAVLAKLSKGV